MSIYDLLAITVIGAGAVGFALGVITTIKIDETHERLRK